MAKEPALEALSPTVRRFFEKFELLMEAPGAVGRLRELVLDVAVQGKLVSQNPAEESADKSLSRVLRERERQAKSLHLRAPVPVIADTVGNGTLPIGWCYASPDELTAFERNALTIGPFGSSLLRSDYVEQGVPLVFVRDIRKEVFGGPETRFIAESKAEELAAHAVVPGDLLITKMGDPPGDTTVYPAGRPPAIITADCIKLTPHPGLIDVNFLKFVLRAPRLARQFAGITLGVAQQKVSLGRFRCIAVPLPPLAEQERIVAKVDELMALCDRLEAQQQERESRHAALARASLARFGEAPTLANLNFLFHESYAIEPADLRRSILSLAVRGLLVATKASYTDWPSKKLKEITTKIGSGATPSGGKESYQESGVPLIRSMNVHFGEFVREGLAYLDEAQAAKLANSVVRSEDLLLNITGASIGRVTVAPKDLDGARVNQHVCIVRPTEEVLSRFLEIFLASPVVQNMIDEVQVGATREALTKGMIEQFEVPLPPLAEQRRIVAKVDQLMILVNQMEAQIAASRDTAVKLTAAIVAELLCWTYK